MLSDMGRTVHILDLFNCHFPLLFSRTSSGCRKSFRWEKIGYLEKEGDVYWILIEENNTSAFVGTCLTSESELSVEILESEPLMKLVSSASLSSPV